MVQKYASVEVLIMMFCENKFTDGDVNHHILNANSIYQRNYFLPESFEIDGKTMTYENKCWRQKTITHAVEAGTIQSSSKN